MRVLITGSRDFAERYNNLVGGKLPLKPSVANYAKELDIIDLRKAWKYFCQALRFAEQAEHKSITYVHGDCPRGFDKICSEWIHNMSKTPDLKIDIVEEKHPADWVTNGPEAGPIRNTEMVELGADFEIAGWDGKREGSVTLDCMSKCAMSGIDLKICAPVKDKKF